MKRIATIFVAFGLCAFIAKAAAHSLEMVESTMREGEPNVEFVNLPAPGVHLRTAAGSSVSLADYRGKVLVLSVLSPADAQASDLPMALIATLQAMVETARLSDRVYFVTAAPYPRKATPGHGKVSAFAQGNGIASSNGQFLYWATSESHDPTRLPANVYGLGRAAGDSERQTVTLVIDQTGRLRARFYGLEFAPVNLVVYVGALVNDDHSQHE